MEVFRNKNHRRSLLHWFSWKLLCHILCLSFAFSRYHSIHKEVYKWFDISFDEFGRTSTPQQTEVCQAIFHKLMENKWLSENTMQQVFDNFFVILNWIIKCLITNHSCIQLFFMTKTYHIEINAAILWHMSTLLSGSTCWGYLPHIGL